jgi:hypothetical protein
MFYIASILFLQIIIPSIFLASSHKHLCRLQEDTYGAWYNSTSVPQHIINSHFVLGNAGQALQFDRIWLPHNCAYHRFTPKTIAELTNIQYEIFQQQRLQHQMHLNKSFNESLHIVLMGDSSLRGIFCSIYRIFQGNEMEGPCQNIICGISTKQREVTIPFIHRRFDVLFDFNQSTSFPQHSLLFSFYYIKSFHWKKVEKVFLQVIEQVQPYMIIFNTGAWDFYELTKQRHKQFQQLSIEKQRLKTSFQQSINFSYCHPQYLIQDLSSIQSNNNSNHNYSHFHQHHNFKLFSNSSTNHSSSSLLSDSKQVLLDIPMLEIAHYRANRYVASCLERLYRVSRLYQVHMIYRNNHYNRRYGVDCADWLFEKLYQEQRKHHDGSNNNNDDNHHYIRWDIWDNRNMSYDTWFQQLYDGFHMDWPVMTYTSIEHRLYNQQYREKYGEYPGMLNTQLAHSILHQIFYEAIQKRLVQETN